MSSRRQNKAIRLVRSNGMATISILSALIILLASCRSERPVPSVTSATETPAATPADNPPSPVLATDEPSLPDSPAATLVVEPFHTATISATLTPPAALPLFREASDRCGTLLPVLVDPAGYPEIRSSPIDVTVPEGLAPDSARSALLRLLSNPGSVGLAAFKVGEEPQGAYLNAGVPMPLASVVKIVNLVAYAEAVESALLDPAEWVPLEEIERYYLPRTDLGAHRLALLDLEQRGLIGREPEATPLEELPYMMIRFSSNAASDYLHMRIGQAEIEQKVIDLGLEPHSAPCPFLGQFLAINNHTRTANSTQILESYFAEPDRYGSEVLWFTNEFSQNLDFREQELSRRGSFARLIDQRYFAENLNTKGTAEDYARLLRTIATNEYGSSYVNFLIRRSLEWPMIFASNQERFVTVGYKNGSLPGVLNSAYYAHRLVDGAVVVVVLFYHDLPNATYRQWRSDLPHDELARWLLYDPAAIPWLRQAVG